MQSEFVIFAFSAVHSSGDKSFFTLLKLVANGIAILNSNLHLFAYKFIVVVFVCFIFSVIE